MCWSSTKTTLLLVSIMCICMNGFNLSSRVFGYRDKLRENKVSAYIPDVTDISKWVNGRRTSDQITIGLAGVSLIFDVILLASAAKEHGPMIQLCGLWGSIDCVADAVIGFLSANYTMPSFEQKKTVVQKQKEEKTEIGFNEPPPATAKQFFHFAWVILRLIIKSQILCSLFEYVSFLSRREEMAKMPLIVAMGGGTSTTGFSHG
ncbi:uncharacterized protein LOC144097885 [Amblyomma americanum]